MIKRKSLSEEHKRKISESLRGKKFTEERLRNMKANNFGGKHHSEKSKKKISESLKGKKDELSRGWVGDNVSYSRLHSWIIEKLGKPQKCSFCLRDDEDSKYEWANISHEYSRDINDFIRLCISCHRRYDRGKIKKKELKIENNIIG